MVYEVLNVNLESELSSTAVSNLYYFMTIMKIFHILETLFFMP